MSNIREVSFRPPINEDLVEMLEELLERAKSGELVGGAFCAPTIDGGLVTNMASTQNRPLEIAAMARLLHRLHLSMDEAVEHG